MLLREIVDEIIRSVNAGQNTQDGKWESRAIEAQIPSLREKAMSIAYFGDRYRAASRVIDYAWVQSITVAKDSVQDEEVDYVTFTVPKPVSLGRNINGIVYTGQKNSSIGFARALNREDIANMKARGLINGESIAILHEGTKALAFGNNMLSEINCRWVFSDPTQVSGFNVTTDDYPISASLLEIMIEQFKISQNIAIQMPGDNTLNGQGAGK